MSGLVCPHCGGSIDVFKTGGGEALADEVGVPLLGRLPIEPKIVQCGDDGVAFVRRFSEIAAATAFAEVVVRLQAATAAAVAASGPPLPLLERRFMLPSYRRRFGTGISPLRSSPRVPALAG